MKIGKQNPKTWKFGGIRKTDIASSKFYAYAKWSEYRSWYTPGSIYKQDWCPARGLISRESCRTQSVRWIVVTNTVNDQWYRRTPCTSKCNTSHDARVMMVMKTVPSTQGVEWILSQEEPRKHKDDNRNNNTRAKPYLYCRTKADKRLVVKDTIRYKHHTAKAKSMTIDV